MPGKIILHLLLLSVMTTGSAQSYFDTAVQIEGIRMLDSVTGRYRVFISGENHSHVSSNGNIELKMLFYLNEKAGLRNFLIELGFARGYMLDKFINGDSSWIDLLKGNTDFRYLKFYRLLRYHNLRLPPERRIRVHGIDVERFPEDAMVLTGAIIPKDKEVPASIGFGIEVLRSYAAYSAKKYRNSYYYGQIRDEDEGNEWPPRNMFKEDKVIDSILADYARGRADYHQFFGKDSLLLSKLMRSLEVHRRYEEYRRTPHQYIYRERVLYDNLSGLMDTMPGERFYGQFGRCHTSFSELNEECDWWAFSSLAKRMNAGRYKDSVMNMAIFYDAYSDGFFQGDGRDSDSLNNQLRRYLKQGGQGKNLLLRVNERDSALYSHFRYVIVNRIILNVSEYRMDLHGSTFMVNVSAGASQFNLDQLNRAIFRNGKSFDEMLRSLSVGFTFSYEGAYVDYQYKWHIPLEVSDSSNHYRLGGYMITQNIGFMPHVLNRFTFVPFFTMGYSRLNLRINNDSGTTVFGPGFTPVQEVRYNNGSFALGAGIDIRFAPASWLGIFARGTIVSDVSGKHWRMQADWNGKYDTGSPRTSLWHYGLQAGISFLFQEP